MDKKQILEFMTANPIFHLATIEDGKPRVRGMLLYRADENGIIFNTGKVKDLYKQLMENPNVELSFQNNNFEELTQVRISGVVEPVEDLELKKEIIENRDFLKPWVEQVGYDPVAVFRMKKGTAVVWTLKNNFGPKEFVEI